MLAHQHNISGLCIREYAISHIVCVRILDSFKNRELVTSGSMQYAGYYTVDFPEEIELDDNERYAVVVKIKTPGASFDISDGEGYISLYGEMWHRAETSEKCNVCLKAFTNKRK